MYIFFRNLSHLLGWYIKDMDVNRDDVENHRWRTVLKKPINGFRSQFTVRLRWSDGVRDVIILSWFFLQGSAAFTTSQLTSSQRSYYDSWKQAWLQTCSIFVRRRCSQYQWLKTETWNVFCQVMPTEMWEAWASWLTRRYMWGRKKLAVTEVGFEPTPEDWCLKPAP